MARAGQHQRHDGHAGLVELQERHGKLPPTLTARTGGGGAHLYFRNPAGPELRNKITLDGVCGVDVRGDGGYVVAPPSLHESGTRYEWIDPQHAIAELPTAWVTLLKAERTDPITKPSIPYCALLTKSTLQFLALGAKEGRRNAALFKAALDMASAGWDLNDARPRLLTGCAASQPPYSDHSAISATIDSAFRSRRGTSLPKRQASTAHSKTLPRPWTPFPIDLLPSCLRSFVEECSAAIGCDPAMVALPALAVVAAGIGATRRIRLKQTWSEPAIIWSLIVAESGELKSPALDQSRKVVDRIQRKSFENHQRDVVDYEASQLSYEADLRHWMTKRGDRGEPPPRPTRPICSRPLVEDITIEAIALILRDNPRGVLLCRDELSGWLGGFDNYHANRGGDVARWLEMHRGGTLVVDRKTGTDKTVFAPRAACCVTGTVQPPVLRRAPALSSWQCDLDRSGQCTPADILTEIDLLNGAGAFDVWNGTLKPPGTCESR